MVAFPPPPPPRHEFFSRLARTLNSGRSRAVLLHGEVHDLFHLAATSPGAHGSQGPRGEVDPAGRYVPLADFLLARCSVPGVVCVVAELNGPLRIHGATSAPASQAAANALARERLRDAWIAWKSGSTDAALAIAAIDDKGARRERDRLRAEFETNFADSVGRPAAALEFLRQLSLCSRSKHANGRDFLADDLLIFIEAADLLLPAGDGDVANLSPVDRQRIAIMQDWFCDPGFMEGGDSVVLIADSRGAVHPRVSRLPQVVAIEIPSPDFDARRHFIERFARPSESVPGRPEAPRPILPDGAATLARLTAGLSLHALRGLLLASAHEGFPLAADRTMGAVEEFVVSRLGEGVVEFTRPTHSLDDVVGFTRLKKFLAEELIPRFRASGSAALPGAAVAGPIGGGKTFLFEAVAAALDLPVLTLKNIRSQWFGQTDAIFERLRALLTALDRVVIFVDEADTQFGGVGADTHETERRLTGRIQQMMSDPALRGRVFWLLMTARIERLSPDIRRPGRVGDLIIPVLDPEGEDRAAFVKWAVGGALAGAAGGGEAIDAAALARMDALTKGWSAAAFAALRSTLKSRPDATTLEAVEAVVRDQIPPDIERARRYQTLQALVNCTRRSLLPDPETDDATRESWRRELRALELEGLG